MFGIDLTISRWFSESRQKPDDHRKNGNLENISLSDSDKSISRIFFDDILNRNKLFFYPTNRKSCLQSISLDGKCEEEEYYKNLGCPRCGESTNLLNSGGFGFLCVTCDFEIEMQHEKRGVILQFQSFEDEDPDPELTAIMVRAMSVD